MLCSLHSDREMCHPRRDRVERSAALENWIFAENLQPFVEVLAYLAGYTLYDEEYDWVTIEYGIQDTDEDEGRWYIYAFAGPRPLTLHLARNSGSDVVSVRVTRDAPIPADLAAQLHLLVLICQSYTLTRRGASLVS